ncbi:telomeric repeat-binding factor 1 isoform X2 [Dasypus novemcinctus]|uniref:telomeric repeat-binding factor 1 isoform X2 n=1 Tax=Dasypus novemcinctus TaxID=9361 RepID=UPI00265E5AD5|nr:telomeric repeat-binding factor 1 isoform X2 [Dasypus novemcinctus]
MAEEVALKTPSPRGRADGEDADQPEGWMAETARDDQEQLECEELLECQVQVEPSEEEEDAGLAAEAEAVAAGWMLDFLCLSLCRAFRDGRSEDFHRTRDSAEAIIHGLSSLTSYQLRTIYICQFLTRIAEGKTLDAQFESDERITPLESALMIWASIEKEHDKLHEEIQNLIKIQAIAVCMENGNFKEAEEVFERIFGDPNSYTAAVKVVESKRSRTIISQDKPNGNNNEMETEANECIGKSVGDRQSPATESSGSTVSLLRSHKDLFLSKFNRGSQQQLDKKGERAGTLQSGKKKKENHTTATKSRRLHVLNNQPVSSEKHRARKKQAWLWEEDKNLRSGVRRYGEGNWSKILLHFKFNNRTSVMLKDRWRTMKKLKLICSDSED